MARDGSGNYDFPWGPHSPGQVIASSDANAAWADLETALTASIATDGQSVITANLPMHGYRHTGVGNASARTHYAAAGQVQDDVLTWVGTVGGTGDAITLTPSPGVTAYAAGQRFRFVAAAENTGATTVDVSALGAKNVFVNGAACVGGELAAGAIYELTYDGTQFHAAPLSPAMPTAKKNYLINPFFQVCQGATSGSVATTTTGYTVDQWVLTAGVNNVSWSLQQINIGDIGTFPFQNRNFIRFSSGGANPYAFSQPIEDVRTLNGLVVTFTVFMRVNSGTGTATLDVEQNFGSGGSASVTTAISGPHTLSSSWQRFSGTVTLPSTAGKTIGTGSFLRPRVTVSGQASSTFDCMFAQLETGPRFTRIEPRGFDVELAACKRYYQASYESGTALGTSTSTGAIVTSAVAPYFVGDGYISLPVAMRIAPTVTIWGSTGVVGTVRDTSASANRSSGATNISTKTFCVASSDGAYVSGNGMSYHWAADARL